MLCMSSDLIRQSRKRSIRKSALVLFPLSSNTFAHLTISTLLATLCLFPQFIRGQAKPASDSADPVHPNGTHPQNSKQPRDEHLPLGVAPPDGQRWHVQVDDRFDADHSINHAHWNGGTGGGMPPGFCGTPATSCGYTGKDCKSYFGTYPKPPFETIDRGMGLSIQATHAAPGDQKYYDNQMADIQSYGKITIHPGSFVQWEAKMPTDRDGEGDGWHVDLWCSTLVRHRCDDSSEVDVAEKILSTANSSEASYIVHDQPMGVHTVIEARYKAPGGPDLSAGFHTYGLLWLNDHKGKQGSLEAFIDGKPIVDHSAPIDDPSWGSGVYCYAGWMQQELGVWGGGASVSSRTSQNDPFYIKRFTVWKAY
jgi:hypothetical protein